MGVQEVSIAQRALEARELQISRLLEIRRREQAYEALQSRLMNSVDDNLQGRNIAGTFDVDAEMRVRMLARARLLAHTRLTQKTRPPKPLNIQSSLLDATERVRGERELLKRCFRTSVP